MTLFLESSILSLCSLQIIVFLWLLMLIFFRWRTHRAVWTAVFAFFGCNASRDNWIDRTSDSFLSMALWATRFRAWIFSFVVNNDFSRSFSRKVFGFLLSWFINGTRDRGVIHDFAVIIAGWRDILSDFSDGTFILWDQVYDRNDLTLRGHFGYFLKVFDLSSSDFHFSAIESFLHVVFFVVLWVVEPGIDVNLEFLDSLVFVNIRMVSESALEADRF